jgi:hypothetical protein
MKDGYRYTSMPPSASEIVLANGHLSTDSFGADRLRINRLGFGYPF